MEEYPEELRTPPVALACLVGCPDVHSLITAHLHSQQPPINAIALPDFSMISVIPPKKPPRDISDPIRGILRSDWLSKHRTRIPSVVAALFTSNHVSGDPAQWLQVCTDLENLKATIRGRNIKLVVVVVSQSGHKDVTSEDRMIALRKRAEVDSKNLIVFVPDDQLELIQSLSRHGLYDLFIIFIGFSSLFDFFYANKIARNRFLSQFCLNIEVIGTGIKYCSHIFSAL
ncbi:PREDICTED: trafficking protein particle complex subunit 11-like [Erythranthe guttata]|uniref:trafficking protein particle complex subunit 11-like n=1 Tax=Erythranthe guttata TaxID=4155 RepID=UPI00064D7841|nr:PREDICTED: trafficking protein particle complex subunit 11-like [Erythranthe guttata]|eukprot:XP_012835189.1 PREDICTED: trafficking protein particle complex subunit 11-like [Erythranthe guttata]